MKPGIVQWGEGIRFAPLKSGVRSILIAVITSAVPGWSKRHFAVCLWKNFVAQRLRRNCRFKQTAVHKKPVDKGSGDGGSIEVGRYRSGIEIVQICIVFINGSHLKRAGHFVR